MKTGLITFHFAHHYGAQLQAYATMRAIQGLGHTCEIIDFRLPHTTRTNELFRRSASVRAAVADAHTALHYSAFKARYDRFNSFVDEQMVLSSRRYTSFEELKNDPPAYDVYVAGSDQIWNPFIYADKQFEPAFLLDFVKEGRRISYAPSLGTPTLPPPYDEQFRHYLSSFDALSAREKRGQDLIRETAGRDARLVLDPTLLLTGAQWGELALPPREKGPYILCYFVSDPGAAAPYAQALAERTGWPIVQLAGARRKIPGAKELVFDAGPREFLGLFQNAACVCTNSFHGAVFSLQFDRPFFTSMSPKELAQPTYSRIYSLLSRLGCADRVIGLDSTAPVDAPMDYEAVHEKLAAARADSLAYLKSAIEGTALPPEQAAGPTRTGPALCAPADCTGCTACASICPVGAISMVPDHEGFLRPVVSDACVLCRKCEAVCPGLHPRPEQEADAQPDPAHAVWCKDDGARQKSTSGGFFTVLARDTLQRGGVVFGAVLENGRLVRHAAARTEAELAPIRGSKYAQSDLGDTFRQVKDLLDGGTPVLFSGLACQVDGLRRYLGREYPQLLTVDLVCHGVPSPAVLAACVERLEQVHGKRITDLRFRDKSHGWQKAHLTALFEDGTSWTEVLYRTAFGRGFGMGLFLRPACAQCRYTSTHRPADFTLGDFWGLDPKLSLPTDREKGISLVLVNSDKAEERFAALSDRFGAVDRPLSEAVAGNPRLASPSAHSPKRAAFFASFRTRPFEKTEEQFLSQPPLPYRMASKVLTPGMKQLVRKVLK